MEFADDRLKTADVVKRCLGTLSFSNPGRVTRVTIVLLL